VITVFNNDLTNPNSLSCSDFASLNRVKPNLILIGTKKGLNFFDLVIEKFSALQKVNLRLNSDIITIFKLDENNALIGAQGGLFILNFSSRN
jgi:ligand-binding sensor domain-containing protein